MRDLVKDATGLDFRQYSAAKDLEGAQSAAAEAVKAAGASHAAVQTVSGTYLIHESELLRRLSWSKDLEGRGRRQPRR